MTRDEKRAMVLFVSAAAEEKGPPRLSGREIRQTETTVRKAPEALRAVDWRANAENYQ